MRKGSVERKVSIYFLVCKGLSNDGVGVARGTVFQEARPGAGFTTGDFVKEKLGGVDCMLGYDIDMMTVKYSRSSQ